MMTDYERVREAITYIEEHASRQPTLDEVADHIGMSPSHFQRTFTRWAGVSPKRFLQALTVRRAKELLRGSATVLDAAHGAGLSGPGRLHDLLVSADAVTPGEFKTGGAGITIRYGTSDSPFGLALVGMTERGICALRFTDAEPRPSLAKMWPGADLVHDDSAAADVVARVFAVRREAGPLSLLLKGTNFQLKVWEALLRIPPGNVVSYAGLAAAVGRPTASRAVANAVGANPIAYAIPCHRVLRSSGALGGYRWGVDRKRVMLARELLHTTDDGNRA